ncbi:MAG: hypothetical protein M0Z84_13340 [Gammaproteobacteria bacterium]|nr:hypothetical protein [Gammaproteobacteria bacterium]
MASVLVVARLCEPSSEAPIAEDWYRRTALPDLLQLHESLINNDRLYRARDPGLTVSRPISRSLRSSTAPLEL